MEPLQCSIPPTPFIAFGSEAGFDGEAWFRRHGTARHFRRNELLYSPGDRCAHAYLVASGEVRISRYTADGRELTLDRLHAGEVFGETEILLGTLREAEAQARTETEAFLLDGETLHALIAREPRFGLWLSCIVSARQARMEKRLETLLFKSANGKVAQVLLHLAEEHGQPVRDGTLIDYLITHQEIGNLIATTRETVSYAFMEFRGRGLISTRQRRTILHDLNELEAIAQA